ncbi:hypothetical protein L7F22_012207 [Adiantum nelumboides]|nr:hypothetical protein [Adiantum nelumboides]
MSDIADDAIECFEAHPSHEIAVGEQEAFHGTGAGGQQLGMHDDGLGGPDFCGQSSNLIDSDDAELLSWLQYPLDADTALQYLPPLPMSPARTSVDFSFPSLPFPAFSFTSTSSSSLAAVKHFSQLQNDAFAAGKFNFNHRAIVNGWLLAKGDHAEGEFLREEQIRVSESQKPALDYAKLLNESIEDWSGACLQDEGLQRGGNSKARDLATSRFLDIKQEFATDSLSNLASYEETVRKDWTVGESQGEATTKSSPDSLLSYPQSKHWINRGKEPDIDCMLHATHSILGKEIGGSAIREADIKEQSSVKNVNLKPDEIVPFLIPAERLQAHPGANAALALGAGRAAGIIRPAGVEAFSNVRTALQPAQPYKLPLGSPSSYGFPLATSSGKCVYSPGTSGSSNALSNLAGPIASHPTSQRRNDIPSCELAQIYSSRPAAVGFSDFEFQERQSKDGKCMGSFSRSNVQPSCANFSVFSPVPDVPKQKPIENATNNPVPQDVFLPKSDTTTAMQKLSGSSLLSNERVVAGYSGGSQTSGSLRETASGSKRKLEDIEGQSEEAEGDSGLSSLARSANSKGPRVNELHNLSERRRRNRINDKMNALRELIPNASKIKALVFVYMQSNKAALLDEAIDYLKNLQFHLQVLSSQTGLSMMPMFSMPHMGVPHYGPLFTQRVGNDGVGAEPAFAAGGISLVGNMGTMPSALTAPMRPHHNPQQFPMPASADSRTPQTTAVRHLQAGAQLHPCYAQPSHQMADIGCLHLKYTTE